MFNKIKGLFFRETVGVEKKVDHYGCVCLSGKTYFLSWGLVGKRVRILEDKHTFTVYHKNSKVFEIPYNGCGYLSVPRPAFGRFYE